MHDVHAAVWTRTAHVAALAGRGDVLVAATSGGVVMWDLSSRTARVITTGCGLPSQAVYALALAEGQDELLAATSNGVACGWMEGEWEHAQAQADERGNLFRACMGLPHGGWIAGGAGGRLLAWRHGRLDSLFLPTPVGDVVALALAPDLLRAASGPVDPGRLADDRIASAPPFPLGLVAGLEPGGVWLLRESGLRPRWLQIGTHDGLPSTRVLALVRDARGDLWVATTLGLCRIGPGLQIGSWPGDPLLSRPVRALCRGPGARLFLGLDDGLASIDTEAREIHAERIGECDAPVVALAWTGSELWWSDGENIVSLSGRRLELPHALAGASCLSLAARGDSLWIGHPEGGLTRFACSAGPNGAGPHAVELRSPGLSGNVLSLSAARGRVFVGTSTNLFVQERLGSGVHFVRDDGAPCGAVRVQQVCADTLRWIGGSFGLWRRARSGWQPFSLWPGASEVEGLGAAAETLWVAAGSSGLAFHEGRSWVRPCTSDALAGATFTRVRCLPSRPLLVATSRGVAQHDAGTIRIVTGSPATAVTDACWWGTRLACATHEGLWLRDRDSSWRLRTVLEGLPGNHIQTLEPAADGGLWVATSSGLGWLPAEEEPPAPLEQGLRSRRAPLIVVTWRRDGDAVDLPIDPRCPASTWFEIFDVSGRCVHRGRLASPNRVRWSGFDAASGVYFARVEDDGRRPCSAVRFLLLR